MATSRKAKRSPVKAKVEEFSDGGLIGVEKEKPVTLKGQGSSISGVSGGGDMIRGARVKASIPKVKLDPEKVEAARLARLARL